MKLKEDNDNSPEVFEDNLSQLEPRYKTIMSPDTYNKNLICYMTLDDELNLQIIDIRNITDPKKQIAKYVIDFPLVIDQDFKSKQIIWNEEEILAFREYCEKNIMEQFLVKEVGIYTASEFSTDNKQMLHTTWIAESVTQKAKPLRKQKDILPRKDRESLYALMKSFFSKLQNFFQ
jgi:hypothetical protein